ncbi:HAD family hydrolase [Haloglycomyces albus]|uniref:HAD family hydrolase n=1 Tax=Haloglycomyces albus TaxID=526067 RepID=UPI00046D62EC|nr:HAD family phosphatase [Haloglycomyces albus]
MNQLTRRFDLSHRARILEDVNDYPQAILWDMDGTLVDTEPLWDEVIIEILAAYGQTMTTDIRNSLIGAAEHHSVPIILDVIGLGPERADDIRTLMNDKISARFDAGVEHKPGAQALLDQACAAGIKQALVTSTNRALTEHLLPHIGRHYFDHTITSTEVTHPKPHPEPYATAARLLEVDVEQCVVVEDSSTGLRSAMSAGAHVVAVPSDVDLDAELKLRRCDTLDNYDLSGLFDCAVRP